MRSISVLLALFSLVLLVIATSPVEYEVRKHVIVRRQDDKGGDGDKAETSEPTKTQSEESTETQEKTDEPSETDKPTGTETEKETKTGKESTTKKPTPTSIDPRKPPGGIQMLTPDIFAPTTYVKMGESATFVWNYTSLIVTPTAIDVVAYCKKNDHGYTILGNETVKETGTAVWDTKKDMKGPVPLMNELYTLQIYDSDLGPSDVPKAGHLGNMRPFIFGVYSPKPSKGLDENECSTCKSSAIGISAMERQALLFMFSMVAITICSFTWFASGIGLS